VSGLLQCKEEYEHDLPAVPAFTCGWAWGGVGLLFEIWIVDASIFRTRVPHVPATLLGWWAGVVWGVIVVFACLLRDCGAGVRVSLWFVMSVHRESRPDVVSGWGWWCV